jgi:hypothetical protein
LAKTTKRDLGPRITELQVQPFRWRDLFLVFGPLLLLVLAPIGYGIWRTYYGYTNFGPAAARSWGRSWFWLAAALLLLLLFYALRRVLRAHYRIEVRQSGLWIESPPARKLALDWDQIWGVTTFSSRKVNPLGKSKYHQHLILHPIQGKPIRVHKGLQKINGLIKTTKKEVYRRIKPKFLKALKNGKQVPFGAVSITRENLVYQQQVIPWRYIEQISVRHGILHVILTSEQNLKIQVKKLQNIEVLIQFIESEI